MELTGELVSGSVDVANRMGEEECAHGMILGSATRRGQVLADSDNVVVEVPATLVA